jgi:hypothetical protein
MSQNRRGRPEVYSKELVEKLQFGAKEDGVTLKAFVLMNFKPCIEAESLKKAGLIYGAVWQAGVRHKVIEVSHYKQK